MSLAIYIVLVIVLFYWLGSLASLFVEEGLFIPLKDRRQALTIVLLIPLLLMCGGIYLAVGPEDSVFAQIAMAVKRERVLDAKQGRSFIQTNKNLAFVYSPGEEDCVRTLVEHVGEIRAILQEAGISTSGKGPVVYLYNNYDEFQKVYGWQKEDVVAFYLPGQIHLLSSDGRYQWGDQAFSSPGGVEESKLREAFFHEYTHHYIYQSVKQLPTFEKEHLPLWFEEGLAVYCASEAGGTEFASSCPANWLSIRELEQDELWQDQQAIEVYVQSKCMVQLLAIKYELKALGLILEQIGAGEDFSGALYNVTRLDTNEYEELSQEFYFK